MFLGNEHLSRHATLRDIESDHKKTLKRRGWLGKKTPLEISGLIQTEFLEALVHLANGTRVEDIDREALGEELADIVLRCFGAAIELDIDLPIKILQKMDKNREAKDNKGRVK